MPSPTHTFPPPSLVRSLEEKQNCPCSLLGPLSSPSSSSLPVLATPDHAAQLGSARGRVEDAGRAQPQSGLSGSVRGFL